MVVAGRSLIMSAPSIALLLSSLWLAPAMADMAAPDSPDALSTEVLQSQGLNFSGAKPWHLKASYTVFDKDGKDPVNGVFEEWWTGPHTYKLSYSRPGFSQTDYATDAGLYRQGEQAWPRGEELWIPISLMEPMPDLRGIKDLALRKAEFTGEAKLRCVAVTGSAEPYPVTGKTYPTFCIDPTSPVVRLSVPYGSTEETTFNRILGFQGHYVAGDIKTYRSGKTIFQLTVDSLEGLANAKDGLFTPPSDAVLLPPGPPSVGSMKILKSAPTMYPALAKAEHWDGAVHIEAAVDRNGHVLSAKVIDGPRMLQQVALDSVNQWIFRPFLVGGEPVEINAETKVRFKLGR